MSIRATAISFEAAGLLLNYMEWSDKQLVEVIVGLECVIPWLEGAGYSRRITGPLRQELSQFYSLRDARRKG